MKRTSVTKQSERKTVRKARTKVRRATTHLKRARKATTVEELAAEILMVEEQLMDLRIKYFDAMINTAIEEQMEALSDDAPDSALEHVRDLGNMINVALCTRCPTPMPM